MTQKKEIPLRAKTADFFLAAKKFAACCSFLCVCLANGQNAPAFTITSVSGSNSLTCAHPAVTLVASSSHTSSVSYSWSNGTITATGATLQTSSAGVYTVVATAGSHSSVQNYTIGVDFVSPVSVLSPTFQNITCSISSVQNVTAMVTNFQQNVMHEWLSPAGGTLLVNGQNSFYPPGLPGTYTHIATNKINGCISVKTFTVASNSGFPSFSLFYSSFIGCSPASATVLITNAQTNPIPGGAVSFTLLAPGSSTIVPSGTLSTISQYTVFSPGTYYALVRDNSNLCTSQVPFTISHNTVAPVLSLSVSDPLVCPGETPTITVSGANTYTIAGVVTNTLEVNPTSSASYTASGTSTLNGCVSPVAAITVSIHPVPALTIVATATAICPGNSVALTALGADTYTWSGGITNGTAFSPNSSAGYTVSGTSSLGCISAPATTSVTLSYYPLLTVVYSAFTVCAGQTVMIQGSGADVITFNNGVINGQSFIPASTATYVAVGTNTVAGCSSTATPVTIVVRPVPVFAYTLSGLQASLSIVSGCTSYSWDYGNGSSSNSSADTVVTYSAQGNYTICVKCTDQGKQCQQCINLSLPGAGSGVAGLFANSREQRLNVFPNPFNEYLDIIAEEEGVIKIYNSIGERVFEIKVQAGEKQLNLNTFPPGIYFLNFITQGGTEIIKVIK